MTDPSPPPGGEREPDHPDNLGCGHETDNRSPYTGTLCSPCYREIEIRIPGLARYLHELRRMAAPGTVSATNLGERVQETREQRLIIDDRLLELADNLYRDAVDVILYSAELVYVDRPYHLVGIARAPKYEPASSFTAQSIEAWIDRNLGHVATLPRAHAYLDALCDSLTQARKAVDPSPPRKKVIRGQCSVCLSPRVTIELRARGTFISTCGACGKTGPIKWETVEAVLRADSDSDASGPRNRPRENDDMAVSSRG